jgi:hypothetical protein
VDAAPSVWHVDVTPARRGLTSGYRVQVTDADGVAQLTESVLPWRMLGLWRATREGALHVGISEVYELRGDPEVSGPLVVFADGVAVVDETAPDRDVADDLVSYGLAIHAVRAALETALRTVEETTEPDTTLTRLCDSLAEALESVW